jgi:hypothetical protein
MDTRYALPLVLILGCGSDAAAPAEVTPDTASDTIADAATDPANDPRADRGHDPSGEMPAPDIADTEPDTDPPLEGFDCLASPALVPEPDVDLSQRAEWSNSETVVHTSGIWAIWWSSEFDHQADAEWLVNHLNGVRCWSLTEFGMADPPNPDAGVFYNIYIHHGADDDFPEGWANGQGTNTAGFPFLTLPNGAHLDPGNIDHEGFHVFQYTANSPGFAYSGDSQWYIESAAQWYAAWRNPTGEMTFVEAGAIDGNPQLALWHSFSNEAPGDPTDWMFQVRQYGMHTYLYYLTEVAGVSRDAITGGFHAETDLLPQAYHFEELGADTLRGHFSDWAAANTDDFSYLTREQVARARLEVEFVGDFDNNHPRVADYNDDGTDGAWARPPGALSPRGWGYNVIGLAPENAGSYEIRFEGDATGSDGAPAYFASQVLVVGPSESRLEPLVLTDGLEGSASVSLATGEQAFLIVAAVPEFFTGNQTYGYQYAIETTP